MLQEILSDFPAIHGTGVFGISKCNSGIVRFVLLKFGPSSSHFYFLSICSARFHFFEYEAYSKISQLPSSSISNIHLLISPCKLTFRNGGEIKCSSFQRPILLKIFPPVSQFYVFYNAQGRSHRSHVHFTAGMQPLEYDKDPVAVFSSMPMPLSAFEKLPEILSFQRRQKLQGVSPVFGILFGIANKILKR